MRRKQIEKICPGCGNTFIDYDTNIKTYCSHECYAKTLIGQTPWNKGIKVSPEEKQRLLDILLKNWNNKDFIESRSGANSHFWQGGIAKEKYSDKWTATLRRSIRERDNYVCQLCLEQQGDVAHHVHHIDYNKKNCNPNNLITLCVSCHSKTNFDRKSWEKRLKKYVR